MKNSSATAEPPITESSDPLVEIQRIVEARRAEMPPYEPQRPKPPDVPPAPVLTQEELEARQRQRDAEDKRRREWEEKCRRKNLWAAAMDVIGCRYEDATVANWIAQTPAEWEAKRRVEEYTASLPEVLRHGTNLFLAGTIGTGKTHLAVGVLRAAVDEHGAEVGVLVAADWFPLFKEMFAGRLQTTERILMEMAIHPKLLLLEDPAPERQENSGWAIETLYRVLDRRYRQKKPTIVTANIANKSEGAKALGQRNYDRLRDGAVLLFFDGESKRKPKAA